MIAIIDYGMGNVRSVYNGVAFIGGDPVITSSPAVLADASHIILPGVGAFGRAMKNLRERGLIEVLQREVIEKGKPFLGICLGLQLLAKKSYEHGIHDGLGWFDSDVIKFDFSDKSLNIPHMGWNEIEIINKHPIFTKLESDQMSFYFVHSFHMACRSTEEVLAVCDYGGPFTAAIARDNIVATQFHPEKSQDNGIQVLENFISWTT